MVYRCQLCNMIFTCYKTISNYKLAACHSRTGAGHDYPRIDGQYWCINCCSPIADRDPEAYAHFASVHHKDLKGLRYSVQYHTGQAPAVLVPN